MWKTTIEIAILWFGIYLLLLFFKDTKAKYISRVVVLIIVLFFLTQILGLERLNWLLTKIFAISIIGFLIIFQPELRRALTILGKENIFGRFGREEEEIEEIVKAATLLSKKKIGALIAIERQIGLKPYAESGVLLESKLNADVLTTIFMPNTALHDGAVIIKEGRVLAAGCLLPLSESPRVSRSLGTRHLAAIGLTEETDAVVVVVSEETGIVSIAVGGKLTQDLDKDTLSRVLHNLYQVE
jgi:diadenylate cyclase